MPEYLERVEKLLKDVLSEDVFELVDIEEIGKGKGFRIFVEKPGGVTIADCAYISERLSERLDIEDFIPHQYTLEVSSPGLERPLKKKSDYDRFQGRLVRITTEPNLLERSMHVGRIIGCKDEMVVLEEKSGDYLNIPFSVIKRARLEMG